MSNEKTKEEQQQRLEDQNQRVMKRLQEIAEHRRQQHHCFDETCEI